MNTNSSSVSGVERAVLLQLIDKLRNTEGHVSVHAGVLTFEDSVQINVTAGHEIFPGACAEEILEVQMQDFVGDYDTPETIPEWLWVAQNASFAHVRNGHDGVWEFVLNMTRTFEDVPQSLQALLSDASDKGISYIIFHQGT